MNWDSNSVVKFNYGGWAKSARKRHPRPSARSVAPVASWDARNGGSLPSMARWSSRSQWGTAPFVVGAFSPLRETLGFDAREETPLLVQRMTLAAAETRSFKRAAIVVKGVGGQGVSFKTIQRVVHDVGQELAERRDADPKTDNALAMRPESPPPLAVVEGDGGRIRTREAGTRSRGASARRGLAGDQERLLDPRHANHLRRRPATRTASLF